MMRRTGLTLLALAAVLALGLSALAEWQRDEPGKTEPRAIAAATSETVPPAETLPARPPEPAPEQPKLAADERPQRVAPESREEITLSYAPIVKRVMPSVVNIYASRVVEGRQLSPFFNDPFFRRFFGDRGMQRGPDRVQNSLGSGVIVDRTGLIVTNHHVIKGADEVRVALSDRREFDAEVVLDDEDTDLAILRIDAGEELPALQFDDSEALEVGDLVLAIGNPFGVGQTVTSGIISATSRTQVGVSDYGFFLQTDAAINPGNSGGALVDMKGRLVGINTAIFSRSGGSHGIGFAIPSNMVRVVVASAENGSEIQRPWFGANLQTVTNDIAQSLGLDRPQGCIIGNVYPGGPAARAGLQTGDVVLAVDGREVSDPSAFGYRFATRGVDGQAEIAYWRDGEEHQAPVELAPAPEDPPRDVRELSDASPFGGAEVANLSPRIAEELDLDTMSEGVVVTRVPRNSIARRVGLRPGDIIRQVNGRRIRSTESLEEISKEPQPRWELAIERDGRVISTVLRG